MNCNIIEQIKDEKEKKRPIFNILDKDFFRDGRCCRDIKNHKRIQLLSGVSIVCSVCGSNLGGLQ